MRKKNTQKIQKNPFNYLIPKPIFGFTNPKTAEIPLKEYCRQLKESQFGNDEGLRLIVDCYLDAIGKQNKYNAICKVFQLIEEMKQSEYHTKDYNNILIKAYNGDMEAIQLLVRMNPEIIHLPFIADGIIKFLDDYKHKPHKERPKKEQWEHFLSRRKASKKNPYPAYIIESAYQLALNEQGKRKSKTKAIKSISKYLGISEREIYNVLKKK